MATPDEIERLRAAAKLVVETWDAEDHPVPMQNLRRAIEGLRKSTPKPMGELEPHAYMPSTMHQGDCAICGHLQGAAIHSIFRRS